LIEKYCPLGEIFFLNEKKATRHIYKKKKKEKERKS